MCNQGRAWWFRGVTVCVLIRHLPSLARNLWPSQVHTIRFLNARLKSKVQKMQHGSIFSLEILAWGLAEKNRAGGLWVMTEKGARSFLVLLILIWVSHICSLIKIINGSEKWSNPLCSFETKIKLVVKPNTKQLNNYDSRKQKARTTLPRAV